jgi:hypothetical protein
VTRGPGLLRALACGAFGHDMKPRFGESRELPGGIQVVVIARCRRCDVPIEAVQIPRPSIELETRWIAGAAEAAQIGRRLAQANRRAPPPPGYA